MHRNIKVLVVLFTTILLFFTFLSHKTVAAEQTSLNVVNPLTGDQWFNFTTLQKNVGDTFIINITVVNVIDLATWQFALQWSSSLLTCVNVIIPSDNVFADKVTSQASDYSTPGLLICAAALLDQTQGFTGSGRLAQVELEIVQGLGQSPLTFKGIYADTFLLDGDSVSISFTTVNGYYERAFDNAPPVISVQSPQNGTYSNNLSVLLMFTIDEVTSWMGYSTDGNANSTISGNLTIAVAADGLHNVTVYANDLSGNSGASDVIWFTVDTVAPNITEIVQFPAKESVLPETSVMINVSVTDVTSGIRQVVTNYIVNGTAQHILNMTKLSGNIFSASIPKFPFGTNVTYWIVAFDNSGNSITTEDLGFECEYSVTPEFHGLAIVATLIVLTLFAAIGSRTKKWKRLADSSPSSFACAKKCDGHQQRDNLNCVRICPSAIAVFLR